MEPENSTLDMETQDELVIEHMLDQLEAFFVATAEARRYADAVATLEEGSLREWAKALHAEALMRQAKAGAEIKATLPRLPPPERLAVVQARLVGKKATVRGEDEGRNNCSLRTPPSEASPSQGAPTPS